LAHRVAVAAANAGYQVTEHRNGCVSITKAHARTGRILRGVIIYPNGTAVRSDVDLVNAIGIRGTAAILKALGIK
jgi:hypothetical protein